jgi:nucleoside-diphosphate-sugar epimerase
MSSIRRVLISGGTGFVGTWMRRTQPPDVQGAYMDREAYTTGFWPIPDFYVHLAPISPAAILNYAHRYGGRVLYASSGAVYDRQTEYADLKRVYEAECLATDVNVVIARLFTFYGDGILKDETKAITQFVKAAATGAPIKIWGDGSTVRSYMHGETMGRWLWAILLEGQNGEAYDVGSDKPVTMLDLAQQVNLAFGWKSPIFIEHRPEECTYYIPRDTAKTRALLRS